MPNSTKQSGPVQVADWVDPCSACDARAASVCRAVPNEKLQRLADCLTVKHYEAGETLVFDGDSASHVYNITSGSVKVFRSLADGRRAITGFLFRGDFLGLVGSDVFSFGAEALESVQLCRFPRKAFRELLMQLPELEAELLDRASHELEAAQDQLLLLSRKTALERVASFILRLEERARERGETGPVHFTMIRADMADYLGLTTETVSRSFSKLKRDGFIQLVEGNAAQIVRRERLEAVAEGAFGEHRA
jgi:CRP/FNR family transcriptional regulator, anaerobic regulatory protein